MCLYANRNTKTCCHVFHTKSFQWILYSIWYFFLFFETFLFYEQFVLLAQNDSIDHSNFNGEIFYPKTYKYEPTKLTNSKKHRSKDQIFYTYDFHPNEQPVISNQKISTLQENNALTLTKQEVFF